MGRPKEHDEPIRDRILAVATEQLAAGGLEAVSVRRVAELADTSTRAIYSLFGDKEGLLRALFHDAAELMTRRHEGVPEQDDLVAEMVALALAYRRAALENPNVYALVMTGTPGFRATGDDVRLARRSFSRVLSTLQRLAAADRLGGRKAEQVGAQIWGLVHGLASLELRGVLGTRAQAERAWRDALETTVHGYERPPSPPSARRRTASHSE